MDDDLLFDTVTCRVVALASLMERENVGATELAEEVGINRSTISLLLRKRRKGSVDIWERMAKYFGLSHEDLITMGRQALGGQKEIEKKINILVHKLSSSVDKTSPIPLTLEQRLDDITLRLGRIETLLEAMRNA